MEPGWKGALVNALVTGLGSDVNRARFLESTFNKISSADLSNHEWHAIKAWVGLAMIKDAGGKQWLPSSTFVQESAAWAAAHPLAEHAPDADLLQAAAANPHSVYAT